MVAVEKLLTMESILVAESGEVGPENGIMRVSNATCLLCCIQKL